MQRFIIKASLQISIFFCILVAYTPVSTANDSDINIGGDFSLTDQNNQSFKLSQLRGKVVLLFFGFTYCPNVCPTELAKVATAIKSIEDKQHLVQGLFVSIDPERDTPEKLKTYVNYFSPDMIGLTGTTEQIKAVTEQYNVNFKINKTSDTDLYYEVNHTANLYVIDQKGKLVSLVPYGFPSSHIKSMLEEILANQS